MKVSISFPPIPGIKGTPMIYQNRQYFVKHEPCYIYPMIPAHAATQLKENSHEVIWDDGIATKKSYGKWLSDLEKKNPEIIALETKTPVVKKHWKIIDDIKRRIPEAKIVLIGDHVTALPEESIKKSKVDYVLTGGDFDFLLTNLANHLEKKEKLEKGIYFRQGKKIKNTGKFELKHNLNNLSFIDRDLTKWKLYSKDNGNYKKVPGTYTMVGRDCWHRINGGCSFCSWTTLYPTFRTRSPESLVKEMNMLIDEYGVKTIFDDTGTFVIGNWLRKFCKLAIENEFKKEIMIGCNMRFNACSFEDYKLMKKAGFSMLLFGLESANQKTLDRLNKGLTVEQIKDSCMKAAKAGLEPHITIMFGHPWETKKDALKTLELGKYLLRKGHASTMQATIITPYPGTRLFEQAKNKGWLKTFDWDDYDMVNLVMKTKASEGDLRKMVQEMYKIAFNPEFLIRKLLSLRTLDDLKFYWDAFKGVIGHIRDFSD
ncbi:MAG: radical SAM protein [Candidatus Aenigmarchaeota archaeon]|nr:radical SAM protein [Candidatus Aenigmarchaeota archaeon]